MKTTSFLITTAQYARPPPGRRHHSPSALPAADGRRLVSSVVAVSLP